MAVTEPKLSPSEIRLIRAYRKLDDDTQEIFAEAIEVTSEQSSHRRPATTKPPERPALRLVAVNGKKQ